MADFTFTEKAWDSARPSSVKKTGIGDAIKAFLKLVPGNVDGLKTADACIKAQNALIALGKTFDDAAPQVKKATDDKKDAAKLLKGWIGEAEDGIEKLKAHKVALVEAMTEPARKKWTPLLTDLESKVVNLVSDIKSADSDAGRAEELLRESMMAMVDRAGDLRSTGHEGTQPDDFLDDGEFRKSHKFYGEQIDIITRSNKTIQVAGSQQKALIKLISTMRAEMREAAEQAGEYVSLPSDNLRSFKKLKADVEEFWGESCSDGARKYATFAFIPESTPANEVESKFKKILVERFAKIGKIDAQAYFEKEFAMHGLSEKQLKKTLTSVQGAQNQVEQLVKSIGAAIKQDPEADVSADTKKLKLLASTLDAILEKHRKGRSNMDMIQFLSKQQNAEAKKFIDNAILSIEKASKQADEAVKELA